MMFFATASGFTIDNVLSTAIPSSYVSRIATAPRRTLYVIEKSRNSRLARRRIIRVRCALSRWRARTWRVLGSRGVSGAQFLDDLDHATRREIDVGLRGIASDREANPTGRGVFRVPHRHRA